MKSISVVLRHPGQHLARSRERRTLTRGSKHTHHSRARARALKTCTVFKMRVSNQGALLGPQPPLGVPSSSQHDNQYT